MKVMGAKKLMKQFSDLPRETHAALAKSIAATARFGERKAKAIVPVASGDLKRGINSATSQTQDRILGFINFYDGDAENGLAANSINYGWGDMEFGYQFRKEVRTMVAARHKRTVARAINKAIKDAVK